MTDTGPAFARITEGSRNSSWRAAIPVVVVAVALVAFLAYLASSLSAASQKAAMAERDAQQSKEASESATKRASDLEKQAGMLQSPGRTTVVLQAEAAAPAGKHAKKTADAASPNQNGWAVATWGEAEDGKTWMRLAGYGLKAPAEGKKIDAWFAPVSGAPVKIASLDPNADGNAFAMGKGLPGVDQGKTVLVSEDAENAAAPEQTLFKADLPKLKPTVAANSPAPAANGAAAPATNGSAEPSASNNGAKPATPAKE